MTDDNQKPREYTWADTEKAEGLMPQYLEAITLREQVARLTAERDALRAEAARIADDYHPEKGQEVLALSEMREAVSALANNPATHQKTAG